MLASPVEDEGASMDWISCSAGLAPLLWVWFEVAVYSIEWGFSCWVSTGCWCLSAPHKQEAASFLKNWVCLILLLEPVSHVPVSSTSAKLCLTHHPGYLPEEHGTGAGTWKKQFWREGAGGSRPRLWKIVCSGVEQRGKDMLRTQKHLRCSGFAFGEDCVLSWTAKMLLAV